MDSGTTLTGILLLLMCILPIVYLTRKRKKRENLFLQSLFSSAEKSNCKISQHDIWSNSAIGIDKEFPKLFFIRKTANNEISKEINLSEIQKCRVITTSRSVITKGGNQSVIDKLELAFANREKNMPEIMLEFYSTDHDSFSLSGELQLTEKWSEIANATIANLAQKK